MAKSIAFGLITGLILALVYIPLTLKIQDLLQIPLPSPVPAKELGGSKHVAGSYWASWLVAPLAVALCSGILVFWKPRRVFALTALTAFIGLGGLLAFWMISLDMDGIAP
ncbi:hypothetical protein [Nocardia seriolae]|uniref:Uncharacterized protein n=2 Tax=Nocardia seriolae TaxID=37332 RepID=A0ABC9Z6C1_9NOCA|nr:hypothetical protein [Nocardia seriolae]APA97089.1 hypothetical protein NS506_03032 [Nocardia seriolae]OJF81847.1 hypothetical protein NS14008_25115 [Nocardia seriolae]PSK31419.1 hypothetical protein C6575_10150 [Nocardia seriolae]RLP22376.1 hypothetical protein D6158_36055 [Nocardia seriolae]WNJ61293.1 hypothetical protein RMO66_11690 [Nocardia seriolae]